jgi:hypothetical protein
VASITVDSFRVSGVRGPSLRNVVQGQESIAENSLPEFEPLPLLPPPLEPEESVDQAPQDGEDEQREHDSTGPPAGFRLLVPPGTSHGRAIVSAPVLPACYRTTRQKPSGNCHWPGNGDADDSRISIAVRGTSRGGCLRKRGDSSGGPETPGLARGSLGRLV